VLYGTNSEIWTVSIDGGTPVKTNLPFGQFGYSLDGS